MHTVLLLTTLAWLCYLGAWLLLDFSLRNRLQASHSYVSTNWNSYYAGRKDSTDPSPRCCLAESCTVADRGRYTVLTTLRTDKYLPLLQELSCSLRRTNPGVSLTIMAVEGDLSSNTQLELKKHGSLLLVDDIQFANFKLDGRYMLNWVKIRVWEQEQWDGIIMIDVDVTVLGDLTHLFHLPADFAAVPDNGKVWNRYSALGKIQAGFIFLRPCKGVAQHMLQLAKDDTLLQFQYANAEQDFFDWYFKYTRYTLPLEYNALPDRMIGNVTLGGVTPRVVHHTQFKPFKRIPGAPGHQFLCSQ